MSIGKKICRRLVRDAYAVSPIIATLMLVLVAVGAAGAFYVWQSGWQKDVQSKTSGAGELQSALTIGGSSTVYEFAAVAKAMFEAKNPNFKIEIQKGGSGAGIAAAGMGLVDIGTASKDASGDFTNYPDLNRDGKKDLGVEMVQTTVAYDGVVVIVHKNNPIGSINRTALQRIYSKTITDWGQITKYHNNTGDYLSAGSIRIADRSDESGTEECFVDKLAKLTGSFISNKQIIAGHCHISKPSNQELLTAIATDPNAIGFCAFGIADLNKDKIKIVPFSTDGTTLVGGTGIPTPATIKSGAWPGSRPLNFITVGKPSGAAKTFIDFVLTPEANQQICSLSDYVSIYA